MISVVVDRLTDVAEVNVPPSGDMLGSATGWGMVMVKSLLTTWLSVMPLLMAITLIVAEPLSRKGET